ncbi:unnamed protein product [Rotaria magnacalcarata]|uniref:EGF-like domain-containing protein n=1 Tax=Rotaria magnacalcarata TaxID=392030 RepID=A0A815KJW2_9BILA|nr:unnamed protein product [Rotaria magnacalcarata]
MIDFYDLFDDIWCQEFCSGMDCILDYSPSLLNFSSSILFRHVQISFNNSQFTIEPNEISLPVYICYDERLCRDFLPATISLNSSSCRHFYEFELEKADTFFSLMENINNLFRTCLIEPNETHYCNHSNMYQCKNSTKCISKYRLLDRIQDCPLNDDETYNASCSLPDVHRRFSCSIRSYRTCLASLLIEDRTKDCDNGEDERCIDELLVENHIYFQTICDGNRDLLPVLIDGRYETDETECQFWLCNNMYSRCDRFWLCKNGADEVNCPFSNCSEFEHSCVFPCNNTYSRCDRFWLCKNGADEVNCPFSNCSEFEHSCVFPNDTSKVSCLPINQAGDSVIHCLGATDERHITQYNNGYRFLQRFKCWNDSESVSSLSLCNRKSECRFGDDEIFCNYKRNSTRSMCSDENSFSRSEMENFFCYNLDTVKQVKLIYFKLLSMPLYLTQSIADEISSEKSIKTTAQSIPVDPLTRMSKMDQWQCNHGIPIRIRIDSTRNKTHCLCPPSYYGDLCEYQSQRVSLTIQVRVTTDWRNVFSFIIILIDDNEIIQSHDYIEYLAIRDCDTKFNVYLFYSTRSKNDFIRIHAFNRLALKYRASWIFPLKFLFLPVHRLSVLLKVPVLDNQPIQTCIHGQRYNYINNQNSTFCQCESGWSGAQCSIEYRCDCAPDSLCIDRSICVCPLGRFGSRCYLIQSSCQLKTCINNDQ